jgi:hypothetical protein
MTARDEHSAEKDAGRSETRIEYALVREVWPGRFSKIVSLASDGRWNENYDAQYAIDHWYPGTVVATRTVTTFEPVVTEWTRDIPPGATS